jgi:hypothetical protein
MRQYDEDYRAWLAEARLARKNRQYAIPPMPPIPDPQPEQPQPPVQEPVSMSTEKRIFRKDSGGAEPA